MLLSRDAIELKKEVLEYENEGERVREKKVRVYSII